MDEPFDFTKLPPEIARVLNHALARRLALDLDQSEVATQMLMLMDDECEDFRDWSRTQVANATAQHFAELMAEDDRHAEVQQRRSQRAKRIARGPLKLIPDGDP